MFELSQQVKLVSVNARAEIHGEERKSAFDLSFQAECSNDVLIHFHPQLRQMLFKKNDNPDLVQQIDESEALTELKFPQMGAIKWDYEGLGYHLCVEHGIGGKSDIKLGDCKVDKFKLAPVNGGSVQISFRVIAHPEAKDVGNLCEKINKMLSFN